MLLNPYKDRLTTFQGTRLLEDRLGLLGASFPDAKKPERIWVVQGLYAPIEGRALGGVRFKLEDQKGFTTFCNQRDFEVLLEVVKPGERCRWTGSTYPEPGSPEWYGLCIDKVDLMDDLLDREMLLRAEMPGVLPTNIELVRRLHNDGVDTEELLILLWDSDGNGTSPDPRLETIMTRWDSVEREKVEWDWLLE